MNKALCVIRLFSIHCHSPGSDDAAAVSDTAFYMIYIQSPQGDNETALAEFAMSECSSVDLSSPADATVYRKSVWRTGLHPMSARRPTSTDDINTVAT